MDIGDARTIGARLRQIREARGKSLEVIAGLAGSAGRPCPALSVESAPWTADLRLWLWLTRCGSRRAS